ncbi:hypothetical protein PSAL_038050 (plasmid) [Pseudooceanicola algae]|uniref:Uncharacterized protein n=1 Tax=Pseudooceanicola algae TaxID=1537215 RepID=A0A7T1BY16_9RHOB|nr:hypothetical protein PSAL_038050 [Pseudooceanicola algae]
MRRRAKRDDRENRSGIGVAVIGQNIHLDSYTISCACGICRRNWRVVGAQDGDGNGGGSRVAAIRDDVLQRVRCGLAFWQVVECLARLIGPGAIAIVRQAARCVLGCRDGDDLQRRTGRAVVIGQKFRSGDRQAVIFGEGGPDIVRPVRVECPRLDRRTAAVLCSVIGLPCDDEPAIRQSGHRRGYLIARRIQVDEQLVRDLGAIRRVDLRLDGMTATVLGRVRGAPCDDEPAVCQTSHGRFALTFIPIGDNGEGASER